MSGSADCNHRTLLEMSPDLPNLHCGVIIQSSLVVWGAHLSQHHSSFLHLLTYRPEGPKVIDSVCAVQWTIVPDRRISLSEIKASKTAEHPGSWR